MRTFVYLSVAALGMAAAVPASAQQAAAKADDMKAYLCQFAGKCDSSDDAAPTKAAPATKGFRLAAPQAATPTQAAPATKGFRLAAQAQSTVAPTQAAPTATKGFRLAHGAPAGTAAPARRTQVAAARPAPVAGTRANLMLNFEYNSDQLTSAGQAKAKTFAQALMTPELKDKRFLIEGHTDSKGSRDLNVDLSRRRAQSVADYLVAQGVDAKRVEVKGVGPDEPLPGRSATAEANRRVEAVLLS